MQELPPAPAVSVGDWRKVSSATFVQPVVGKG
jgi:hypothetical protein